MSYRVYMKINQDRSFRVRWLLKELDVPHTVHALDLAAGEHEGAAFRALNPLGKVPVLECPDGSVRLESAAICLSLAEEHPERGLAPAIGDPDRARYLEWCLFGCTSVENAWTRITVARDGELGPETGPGQRAAREGQGVIDYLSARLTGPYALGERFSAADVVLGYSLVLLSRAPYPLEDVPLVADYMNRLRERWTQHGLEIAFKR